jgi:hypothetical protein
MRPPAILVLLLATGCASTLYSHYAGPVTTPPAEVYACVQEQMKTLGYNRKQYNEQERWFLGTKVSKEPNSSGLYRETVNTLDTRVKVNKSGAASLDIVARTYDIITTARGDDQQERKASERVQNDARTLGLACSK